MGQLLDLYLKNDGTDDDKKEVVSCYESILDNYPRDIKINILEIGAGKVGASIKMWKEYFYNANLYSFDPFFLPDQEVTPEELRSLSIVAIQGNQLSKDDLLSAGQQIMKETGTGIDLIIDDAAHMSDAIQLSIGTLFPFMNRDGIYFVEDLNTAIRRDMDVEEVNENLNKIDLQNKMNLKHSSDVSFFDAIHSMARKGKWESNLLNESDKHYLSQHIVHASIIGKDINFSHELYWEFAGNSEKHTELREFKFHVPHLGILRKTKFAGVSESVLSKSKGQ